MRYLLILFSFISISGFAQTNYEQLAKDYLNRAKETITSDSLYQGAITNFKLAAAENPGNANYNLVVTYLRFIQHYNTSSPLNYRYYLSKEKALFYIEECKKELEVYYSVEKDERSYTVKKAQINQVEKSIK